MYARVLFLLLALLIGQLAGASPSLAEGPRSPLTDDKVEELDPSNAEQFANPPEVKSKLAAEVTAILGKASAALSETVKALRREPTDSELSELRARVEEVLDSTAAVSDRLGPRLAAVKSQIEKLGPVPGPKDAAEAPAVAAERARLIGLAGAYTSAAKTSELTSERARQLIARITVARHSLFTRNLMERLPSPLTPGAWREVAAGLVIARHNMEFATDRWWAAAAPQRTRLMALLAAAVGLVLVLRLALWKPTRRRNRRTEPPLPTFFERAVSAFWVAALRLLPVLLACFAVYVGLDALGLVAANTPWGELIPDALGGILVFSAIAALLRAVLAPAEPQWRLVDLADKPARRLRRLLTALAAVYALDGVLTEMLRVFYIPLSLSVAQSSTTSLAFAALMIGVLLTPMTPAHAREPTGSALAAPPYSRHRPRWLKLPLWLLALGIIIAVLLGYAALARFAAQQLLLTGVVGLLCWLCYLAIRAFTRESTEQSRALAHVMERQLGLDQPRRKQLASLTELAVTFALVLVAVPILMLQWGFSAADIRDWSKTLLFGFEIGQVRISLVRILVGIVLFIALLLATRLIQRWMRDRAQQSRLDASIANSIDTVVGYAGISLAALVSLSYAGLDITNLAIVAGALSLGIGFGLQSIVNNFVSGLILLIERPIKVGDRVVIGDKEGYVRRISVRATEVETFDKASVIVPNSELITGRVVNWSHRDWRGAVSLKVGVAYDADPDAVIAILKQCAQEHSSVLPEPAPNVFLEAFGDSALLFNLRIALADIDKAYGVQSDLRFAILKAFRANGIEIPFNQLDVTLRATEAPPLANANGSMKITAGP